MKEIILNTIVKVCSYDELSPLDQQLADAAREAAKKSYAPYSRFNVGAAVRLTGGEVVCGSNQENAAYPSGLCAERTTLFWAGAQHPDKAVEAIAIAARNENGEVARPISPCGACRQVMLETEHRFSTPMKVVLYGEDMCYVFNSAADLLPLNFVAESLLG